MARAREVALPVGERQSWERTDSVNTFRYTTYGNFAIHSIQIRTRYISATTANRPTGANTTADLLQLGADPTLPPRLLRPRR